MRRIAPGGLVQFVPRGVGALVPKDAPPLPQPGDGDPLVRARAVFVALAHAGISYGHEPTTSEPDRQVIRPAREILAGPRSGTCLDLAVLYAGACLDAGSHPTIVVLDPTRPGSASHALTLVWTGGPWSGHPDPDYPDLLGDDDVWAACARRGAALLRDAAWRWALAVDVGLAFDAHDALPVQAPPRVEPLVPPYHEADPSDPDHRDGPLALLRPRSKAVPFCARDDLDALRDWFEPDPGAGHEPTCLRIALVHGVGGCGKTRLAAELCHRLSREGWYAGFARRRSPAGVPEYLAEVAQPLLVVIDYPEGVSEDDLIDLLRPLATRQEPTGVLLTARRPGTESGQWWESFAKLARNEDITFLGPRTVPLDPQHPSPAVVFRRARTEFLRRARDGSTAPLRLDPLSCPRYPLLRRGACGNRCGVRGGTRATGFRLGHGGKVLGRGVPHRSGSIRQALTPGMALTCTFRPTTAPTGTRWHDPQTPLNP
jgi:hypothetical protein